jgi:signal transduction histidine kinase
MMRPNIVFNLILLVLFVSIVAWGAYTRYSDYVVYHKQIAHESAAGVVENIKQIIGDRKRHVTLFTQEHTHQIDSVMQAPHVDSLREALADRLRLWFPSYFAFTVADDQGVPLLDNFEGSIGEQCRKDLTSFARDQQNQPRLHPNDVYHYDVMAHYNSDQQAGIFFISFDANELGKILKAAHSPGHELVLVYKSSQGNLIEITELGARNQKFRPNYFFNEDEEGRILYELPVEGTRWHVIDLHSPALFTGFVEQLVTEVIVLNLIFIGFVILMLIYLRREETLRVLAERHKDDFLSVVSHELRTPLTSIRGSLGLIFNGAVGDIAEKPKKLVELALRNSERLVLLVNDILDIQKMQAGKLELHTSVQALVPLLEQAIEVNKGYATQYNVTFELVACAADTMVNVDAVRMGQVLSNLLSNAAKYSTRGDNVQVRAERDFEQGIVRVAVVDHGPGIPAQFEKNLFDKFAQADGSSTRQSGGTGLGLNIVKLLIEMHGGRVGYEPTTGGGATLYFELPLS